MRREGCRRGARTPALTRHRRATLDRCAAWAAEARPSFDACRREPRGGRHCAATSATPGKVIARQEVSRERREWWLALREAVRRDGGGGCSAVAGGV